MFRVLKLSVPEKKKIFLFMISLLNGTKMQKTTWSTNRYELEHINMQPSSIIILLG